MNDELSRKIEIDEDSGFGVATPFLKSFMQVIKEKQNITLWFKCE